MAIQTNSRKRKHEATVADGADDAEEAVPKKLQKESHTPKRTTKKPTEKVIAEQVEDGHKVVVESDEHQLQARDMELEKDELVEPELNSNSEIERLEKPMRFPNDFKMMEFRNKLLGNNFITELRHFLHMCQVRPKIVAKYIEKRGKPLELVEAFNRIDKTNILHVGYLCEALQRIIMEILTHQKEHMESAAHAGRYFLKAHGTVIEKLLKSQQISHRRSALKLLTAIVCMDAQLGRQVLSSYSILSNTCSIGQMLSQPKHESNNEDSVRKAYIHFVLAYLVDGNTLLIRNLLDRPHLIGMLVKGLHYDDHVTVCAVLNALRQYVLENPNILKTQKIHVFDLECCKNLHRLYNWVGPQGLAAVQSGSKQLAEPVPEERDAVADTVHQMLLLLFTSRKFGICFDAMSNYRQKHNKLQGKILGSLYQPYADKRKTELILKTLQACPDLGRRTVRHFASIVNSTQVKVWPEALHFLAQIIEAVPPGALTAAMNKMTLTDFGYWIKEVCLPIEALLQITGKNLLKHMQFKVRLAVNRLLLTMMTQYRNYVSAVAVHEQSKRAGNSLRKFKFELLNHLLMNFPSIESILYSLYMSIEYQLDPGVNVLDHLSVTLELILIMCKENRAFVSKTSQILNYLDVLRPLYETNFEELADKEHDKAGELSSVGNIKLELKAIKTILLLFPRALHPQEELFGKVLRSFMKAYMWNDLAVKTEAAELLHSLFKNTGMFDSSSYEIDIWLEALHGFDWQTVDAMTKILLNIFSLDLTKVENLPELNAEEMANNVDNLRKLFAQIEQGQTVQAYVETLTLSKMMPLLLQGVTIQPPYDAYVELVCVLLYHYHTKPEQVQKLYTTQLSQESTYMKSWQNLKPAKLSARIVKQWPQLGQLQQLVLDSPESKTFDHIFQPVSKDEELFELELVDGSKLQLDLSLCNPYRNMVYAHTLLFLLTQLMTSGQLRAQQAQFIADCLIRLLQIAVQVDGEQQTVQLTDSIEQQRELQEQQLHETHTQRLLHYIYGIRLSQLRATHLLSETSEAELHYVSFLRRLTEYCRSLAGFDSYTSYYRQQLVVALQIALENGVADCNGVEPQEQLLEVVALVDAFELKASECVEMLQLLTSKLHAEDFLVPGGKTNHYFEMLIRLLRRLAQLQEPVDCNSAMLQLQIYYAHFCDNVLNEQLEQLEKAALEFLSNQHHHLAVCTAEFFGTFFSTTNRKLSKSAIRLACLLLQRDPKLSLKFIELLPQHVEQKELIYPLLDVAFSSGYELKQSLLQQCYQSYKNGILKSIEKPQKAAIIYREHALASAALIAKCMPKSECLDYCQKQLKFDAVELFQMRVLREIYKQALSSSKDEQQQNNTIVSYVNLNVQMLAIDLKKQSVQMDKLEQLTFNVYDWFQTLPHREQELDWSRLLSAAHWMNFCRSCLKQAMHMPDEEHRTSEQDSSNGLLLKLLAYLCDKLYNDYNEQDESQGNEDAGLLYEMACTHSCCYDHLLGEGSAVKTHLLQLLETLARKAPTALHHAHIPVILGAYHAQLTPADRYALALLEHYERFDVGLAQYRPFIWGESAVDHYSLRATDMDERAKLQQQETNVSQVMALIVGPSCRYTIENFPIWRTLHASKQLPELNFVDPSTKFLRFGDNPLEQSIEQGCTQFSQDLRRLCPKREDIFEQCYDPAFMIPLMMHCFAPESAVRAQWPVQNGLLALSFCALSSLDKDMRLAAACCQQRYRAHFELSRFYEKPLWTQAYDNIQSGLAELRDSWLAQRRTHGGTPRVPLIPTLFIAHSFNISTDPTHLLYKRLMTYLQLKQSFNFQTIPEFNIFFYSQEPEHEEYREFIVQLLSNGIKCSADLFLLVSTNTFKVLLSFYGSNLATLDINLLLLSVLSTCVKIPGAIKIMLGHVGILSWLMGAIRDAQFYQFDIIEGIISIINNLWYAVVANQCELSDYSHIQLRVHRLVLQILPILSPRVSIPSLARLLNVLQKTSNSGQYIALTGQQLDILLECISRHWPEHVASLRYLRTFGGVYAGPRSEYCNLLAKDEQIDMHSRLALCSLRQYVIDWWQAQNQTTVLAKSKESPAA